MKRLFLSLLGAVLLSIATFAQTPQLINYQGLARDNSGAPLLNQLISIQFSILSGSATGTAVYIETQQQTTDAFGLFSLQIGNGTVLTGTFTDINWGNEAYFLKVEIDFTGGTNYSLAGITQFGSVPTSIHAANGLPPGQNPGNMLYWDGTHWLVVPAGASGQVLRFINSVPTWTSPATAPSVITTSALGITNSSAVSGGTVSDGGAPVTARGVCWSQSPNPGIADNYTMEGTGSGGFTSSITGLKPGTDYHIRAYATNSLGTVYGSDISFTTATALTCGFPLTAHHTAGTVAPVTKTVTYGTVTNIPGEPTKCWITSNLGADHQATSMDDASEASAGWYWQFNRKQGYKNDGTIQTPNTQWINPINENSDWLTANDPCTSELGTSWRLPTATEWSNINTNGNWSNWTGPWNSGLKLHAAGSLVFFDGSLGDRGSRGMYWSSNSYDGFDGTYLFLSSIDCEVNNLDMKSWGNSVRCLNDFTAATSSLPTVTTTSVTAIASATATGGGNVTADGGATVTARGICWSTASNPTITDSHTTSGNGTGAFTSNLTALSATTLYHVRAYATNSIGTTYGGDVSFTTLSVGAGSFTCGSTLPITHTAGTVTLLINM